MDLSDQLRREREKFRLVQDITQAVGSTLQLDELLHLIVDKITVLMNADRSTLYLLDEERGELWTRVIQADEVREIRLSLGEGIAGWVAQSGNAVNIADAYQDQRFSPKVDRRTGYRTRSILCVPMREPQGRVTGVVQVLNKRHGFFTGEDEELLSALASQASIALENSKLYLSVVRNNRELMATQEALERRMRELDLLLEVQQEIGRAADLDQLLSAVLLLTGQRMGAEAVAVVLRNEGYEELYFRPVVGDGAEGAKRVALPPGGGFGDWMAEEAPDQTGPLGLEMRDDPCGQLLEDRLGFHTRSMIHVPLRGQETVFGGMALLNRVGDKAFDEGDTRLLTLIAGRAAPAIELVRYREQRLRDERLAEVGGLLSGLLHDLKTPMTIISGHAQLMIDEPDAAVREEGADKVLAQLDMMGAMAGEVLAFARGDATLLVRKVYLQKFMGEMEEHLKQHLAATAIELRVETRYRGVAYFDENKLRRVFHNIAVNAAHAMPQGGCLTVSVDTEGEDWLHFGFSDTGMGIPEELEGRLFDAFVSSGKESGTGLGLAIVKKIVDDHQGEIRYRSAPGRGTTFDLMIPLKAG